jgi:GTP cyclohydrolase I
MSYTIKWIGRNVYATFEGRLDFTELDEANHEIYSDSRYDTQQWSVFDFLDVKEMIVTEEDIMMIAVTDHTMSRLNKKVRVACIAKDEYIRQLTIEYIKLMRSIDWKISLFESKEEALVWCKSHSQ